MVLVQVLWFWCGFNINHRTITMDWCKGFGLDVVVMCELMMVVRWRWCWCDGSDGRQPASDNAAAAPPEFPDKKEISSSSSFSSSPSSFAFFSSYTTSKNHTVPLATFLTLPQFFGPFFKKCIFG